MKIVSGGQTGVDRGALDAALETGVPCGGWCPASRKAEDGRIPDRYPMQELPGAGYVQRTRQNVIDSDATLVIAFGAPEGGTALTVACCEEEGRPYIAINAAVMSIESAVPVVLAFLREHRVRTLNVAGTRASKESRAYVYAKQLVAGVIAASRASRQGR